MDERLVLGPEIEPGNVAEWWLAVIRVSSDVSEEADEDNPR